MTEHVILWLIGVVINLGIAVFIAAYFRYRLKPRIEVIFERNERLALELLFSQINIFDSDFIHFCNYAQKEIDPLPKDDRTYVNLDLPIESVIENDEVIRIIPNIKDHPEIKANNARFDYGNKFLKEFLKRAIDQEKIIYEHHLKDNKYSDNFFTHFILVYLSSSVSFMQGITQNYSHRSFFDRRLEYAKSIITKLKEDELIPKTGSIRDFVDKWEKYIESEKK